MISCDVKTLFTNVPLDETIAVILIKVFDKSKIMTNIPRETMKQLSLLCTKHVHFIFNGEIYIKVDGVAMGSPLGPLLANMFMSTLEEHLIPTLGDPLIHWKGYVDNTHACINPNKLDNIIKAPNGYHPKIQFTYHDDLEKEAKIPFLDVSITRLNNKIIEKIIEKLFRKETNTNVYINWNLHALTQWKIVTLRNLMQG